MITLPMFLDIIDTFTDLVIIMLIVAFYFAERDALIREICKARRKKERQSDKD